MCQAILFNLIKLEKGDKILDIGCGIGGDTLFYLTVEDIKYIGIDILDRMLLSARKKIEKMDKKDRAQFFIADAPKCHSLVNI